MMQKQTHRTDRHTKFFKKGIFICALAVLILLFAIVFVISFCFRSTSKDGTFDSSTYRLTDTVIQENKYGFFEIKEAVYQNGNLYIYFITDFNDNESLSEWRTSFAEQNADFCRLNTGNQYYDNEYNFPTFQQKIEEGYCIFTDVTLPSEQTFPKLQFLCGDIAISFSMEPVNADQIDQYSHIMTERGGVLTVSRTENEMLIIDLYPLNCGGRTIDEYILSYIPSFISSTQNELTVTSEDGTILTGMHVTTNPQYTEWEFGLSEAGEYTLHIPYIVFKSILEEDIQIPLNFEQKRFEDTAYKFPDFTVTISSIETPALSSILNRLSPDGDAYSLLLQDENTFQYYTVKMNIESKDGLVPIFNADNLMVDTTGLSGPLNIAFSLFPDSDLLNQEYLVIFRYDSSYNDFDASTTYIGFSQYEKFGAVWPHSLDIPVTVTSKDE